MRRSGMPHTNKGHCEMTVFQVICMIGVLAISGIPALVLMFFPAFVVRAQASAYREMHKG